MNVVPSSFKTNGDRKYLMSLPPRARWVYDHQPEAGSEEEKY